MAPALYCCHFALSGSGSAHQLSAHRADVPAAEVSSGPDMLGIFSRVCAEEGFPSDQCARSAKAG